jgi:predicted RNA binding protein YcfA (HicA-like mRNA interferase family)
MPKLPTLSGQDVARILESFGWSVARQRGSHIIMTKEGHMASLSIPNHQMVAKGTLRSLLRYAGLTVEQFVARFE